MKHIRACVLIVITMLAVSCSFAIASEEEIDYKAIYSPIIENVEDSSAVYGICDFDNDGIAELILEYDTGYGDYINEVWTITDGIASYIGNFSDQQNLYIAPDENGIYAVYAHMGQQTVTQYTIEDDELIGTIVSEDNLDEVAAENDFEYDWDHYLYTNDDPISLFVAGENAGLEYAEDIMETGEEPPMQPAGKLITYANTGNFRDTFRDAVEGNRYEIDNAHVSKVFAGDSQLLCYIYDLSFNYYYFYIFTDNADYYMVGDNINVIGDYWESNPDNNYPVLEDADITLLN